MIDVKDSFRVEVEALRDFDLKYGKVIDEGSGQFTGNCWHQTVEILGKKITYYYQEEDLICYEKH